MAILGQAIVNVRLRVVFFKLLKFRFVSEVPILKSALWARCGHMQPTAFGPLKSQPQSIPRRTVFVNNKLILVIQGI
jgi:hypothetical protein